MAEAAVVAANLSKRFGARVAVDDISFRVERGECLALLGPNGAGKTTIIKMVTCVARPTAGSLTVLGHPMSQANHTTIKARLGIVQQEESLDPDLSVEKNLTIYASYFAIPRRDAERRSAELMEFVELSEQRRARIHTLSGGMKRRLMLARALINEPEMLVLDEPTTGLDPQVRRLVWERIRSLKRQGLTILLTTHYMEEAAQLSDRVIVIDRGRIIAEGDPATLIQKHVGAEVVEVRLDEAEMPVSLTSGAWRSERVGDVLYLYLMAQTSDTPLLAALRGLDFTRRRATLEDVFLTLTGHGLRE